MLQRPQEEQQGKQCRQVPVQDSMPRAVLVIFRCRAVIRAALTA